jgi:hypothetical protein
MNNSIKLNSLKKAYVKKFYNDIINSSYNSAKIYLDHLWEYIKPQSVLDVGRGNGLSFKVHAKAIIPSLFKPI